MLYRNGMPISSPVPRAPRVAHKIRFTIVSCRARLNEIQAARMNGRDIRLDRHEEYRLVVHIHRCQVSAIHRYCKTDKMEKIKRSERVWHKENERIRSYKY